MTDDQKVLVVGGIPAEPILRALEQAKDETCPVLVSEPYEITIPLSLILVKGAELARQEKQAKQEKQKLPKPPRNIGVAPKNLFAHQRRFGR